MLSFAANRFGFAQCTLLHRQENTCSVKWSLERSDCLARRGKQAPRYFGTRDMSRALLALRCKHLSEGTDHQSGETIAALEHGPGGQGARQQSHRAVLGDELLNNTCTCI